MKKVNYIVGAAAVLLIVFLTAVRTPQKQAPPAYNAAAEVSVSGTVEETREFFCPLSDEQGTHLVLRTQEGPLLIHVAPARFLRSQEFIIKPNDEVSVVGARANYQGQDAMLAREITHGNDVLIVRDHQGRPLWLK
jgi:hypothetical protein